MALTKRTLIAVLIAAPWLGAGCAATRTDAAGIVDAQPTLSRHEYARVLMGSRCRIVVYAPDEPTAAAACAAAFARVSQLEHVLSDYDPESEASRLTRLEPARWHDVSHDLADTLRKSRAVHDASGGGFDPIIGPLTKLWRQTRRDGRLPAQGVLDDARARSGFALLEIDHATDRVRFARDGMGLDFGGIGKGLAADEALHVLRDHGLGSALIDFGGDLTLGDAPPDEPRGWRVEVRDGLAGTRVLWLADRAVATSGDLEQSVEIDGVRYAHILDPRAGLGLTRRVAATVVADEGWLADALASAACVLGPDHTGRLEAAFPGVDIVVHER